MFASISVCHFKYHSILNNTMFFSFIVLIIDIPLSERYHTSRLSNNGIKCVIKNIISEKKHEKTIYIKDG